MYPEAPDLLVVTNRGGGLSVWNTSQPAKPHCVHSWMGNGTGTRVEGQDRMGELLVIAQLGDKPSSALITMNATSFAPLARLPLSVDGALHTKLYRSANRTYAITHLFFS